MEDPCVQSETAEILLGQGVGGEFAAFGDGAEVGLSVAPQGGFGVSTVIRTFGVAAGTGTSVDLLLDVEVGGQNAGSFLLEDAALQCADGVGGQIFGQVVGFDPDTYRTNDDLLALDGQLIDLVVTLTEADGSQVSVRQPVTLRVGG